MIQINPERMIRIELTPKEQKTILTHCRNIDKNIYDRIQNVRNGVLHLLIEDCYYLTECVKVAIQTAKKPKVQNILGNIFNKISPNPATRSIAKEIEGQDFDNIDDLNDHIQGIMEGRNKTPDPEMGDLSPDQVNRLIYLPWDDDNFPLKFNKELKPQELQSSTFFTNTTIFLKTLIEMEKYPTATVRGNLNRKIVKILFDKLILDEDHKRFTLEYNKVINEIDVFPLHIIRVVCEEAGLIFRIKNRFLISEEQQHLLSEKRAGELYYLLFNTYFRKFNLGYLDRLPELGCIQQTIEYPIYRMGEIADNYINMEELANEILLPAVLKEIKEEISEYINMEWLIGSRIIDPLQGFGLLECSYREKKGKKGSAEVVKVRKTGLFDRFMGVGW